MTKTLADMTPEERASCRGMWCDHPSNVEGKLAIIYEIDEDGDPMLLRFDVRHEVLGFAAEDVTPRYDLPRSWNPDGTPVEGDWLPAGSHARIIPKGRRAYVTMSEEVPNA